MKLPKKFNAGMVLANSQDGERCVVFQAYGRWFQVYLQPSGTGEVRLTFSFSGMVSQ